jgi:prepilin-type N-terminal cleavage/methylation domain-containing protein
MKPLFRRPEAHAKLRQLGGDVSPARARSSAKVGRTVPGEPGQPCSLQLSDFSLPRAKRTGFSLIEINIVLLVIGIGLVALLGLFPVGLRQAGLATSDSASSMFADQVLSALHAQSSTITNWTDWKNFKVSVLQGAKIGGTAIQAIDNPANETEYVKLDDYLGVKGSTIRYQLVFASVTEPLNFGGRLMRATIRVSDRDQGNITQFPLYCTDFVFMGPAPR